MNIGLFILRMDYCINKRNHFILNEFISSLATRRKRLTCLDCNNSPIQDYLDPDDHAQPTDSWVQTLHCETCFNRSPSGFAGLLNRPQLFKRWTALFT